MYIYFLSVYYNSSVELNNTKYKDFYDSQQM